MEKFLHSFTGICQRNPQSEIVWPVHFAVKGNKGIMNCFAVIAKHSGEAYAWPLFIVQERRNPATLNLPELKPGPYVTHKKAGTMADL